jgi:hypothetical protein
MAKFVLKNASVSINSVDLSDHVSSVSIDYSAETPESTCMGDTSKTRLPGLLDWKMEIEFRQDFASAKVDATLFPLVGAAAFAVIVKPDAGAIPSTNPAFTGNALLASYNPVAGKVGDIATTKASLVGTGVLDRDTTP